jgi:hypothetical protein
VLCFFVRVETSDSEVHSCCLMVDKSIGIVCCMYLLGAFAQLNLLHKMFLG